MAKMLDIVLGCFWVTKKVERREAQGAQKTQDTKHFESPEAAMLAYDFKNIDLREPVKVLALHVHAAERRTHLVLRNILCALGRRPAGSVGEGKGRRGG